MPAPTRLLLLGHRGARGVRSIPENTLDSFDRAMADGCDGFEFDVRRTADGRAVICHDPRFGGVEIADATADEVDQLPHLDHVLTRYQERAFLDIELKVSGLEKITAELLRKCPPRRGFVVSSFLPEVLLAIRAEDADVPLGLICETQSELLRWKELRVKYVILHRKLATPSIFTEIKEAGKRILVWTVNNPAQMTRLSELGADGIISDETSLLFRVMENPRGG